MPQVVGGVEVNTHALAGELLRRGNAVCVLAKLSLRNRFGVWRAARMLASGRKFWVDRALGYPVFRSRQPANHTGELPRPTVAVIQNGPMLDLAAGFARIAVPSVAYLHGLGFETWPEEPAGLPFRGYIANSQFTAERFRRRFGVDPTVLPPLFRRADYAIPVTGSMVTFINPVAVKGVELALEIAGEAALPLTLAGVRACLAARFPGRGEPEATGAASRQCRVARTHHRYAHDLLRYPDPAGAEPMGGRDLGPRRD